MRDVQIEIWKNLAGTLWIVTVYDNRYGSWGFFKQHEFSKQEDAYEFKRGFEEAKIEARTQHEQRARERWFERNHEGGFITQIVGIEP